MNTAIFIEEIFPEYKNNGNYMPELSTERITEVENELIYYKNKHEETKLLLKNIYDYTQKIVETSSKYTDIIKSLNTKLQEHEDKTKLTFKHAKVLKDIKKLKKSTLKETVIINNRIENRTNSFLWPDLYKQGFCIDLYKNVKLFSFSRSGLFPKIQPVNNSINESINKFRADVANYVNSTEYVMVDQLTHWNTAIIPYR